MRRKTPFLILLIAAVVLCLFACDSEVTDIVAKGESFSITIGSSVDIAELVEVSGKGDVDVLIEPSGIVSVEKNKLTGLAEGSCTVTVYSGEKQCRFRLNVTNGKKITMGISDQTFTYSGGVKTLTVEGTYPSGTKVVMYNNGEVFNGAVEPGTYEVELEVTPPEGYDVEYVSKKAILTIDKIYADMSAVRFAPANYAYDGTEKKLIISGTLPAGVAVRYENNAATDVGTYLAKAYFSVDEKHYHSIEPMGAKLTILKCDLSNQINVTNVRATFDKADHFPTWELPVGVTAEYFVYNVSTMTYIPKSDYYSIHAANHPFVNSGTYTIKTVFNLDESMARNYTVTAEKVSTVTITKADFTVDLAFEDSSFSYDGTEKTVGLGDLYDVGLVGTMPKDINNNVIDGVTVEFYYGSTHDTTLSFTNAGNYFIRAKLTVPNEYLNNYNAIEDVTCSLVISKVVYPSNFTFDANELYGELDFSTPHVYDGTAHYFALTFPTQGDKDAFTADINIKYYYKKDNESELLFDDEVGIINAGVYTIGYRLSFVDSTMSRNYTLPSNGSFNTSITKVIFNMTSVSFPNTTISYDGEAHTPILSGVPAGVASTITGGSKTNAGTYTVSVSFAAETVPYGNYYLQGADGELTYINAILRINKADYVRSDVPDYYTEAITYSPSGKLSDVTILLGGVAAQNNISWLDGNEKPVCNVSAYDVVYNADTANRNDFVYKLPLTVNPLTLEGNKFAVADQFVAYTGAPARPKITYDGATINGVSLSYNCETEAVDLGTHVLTDSTLVLDDEINYAFDGSVDFGTVTIHIFDGSLFRYNGLILERYIGGQNEVSVPTGTTNIANGAFSGCSMLKLTIPESVTSMSSNALGGITYLRELVLPYIGTQRATGVFSGVFGGVNGIPSDLVKVTVTDITELPDNAFKDAANLTQIVFTQEIVSVGQHAFDGCASLTSMSLTGITYLGSSAFRGCFDLISLSLPFMGQSSHTGTITYLFGSDSGDNAYTYYSLETLDFSSGTFTGLFTESFKGMVSLRNLTLPTTLASLEADAFGGTYADVVLNDNFTSVRSRAFYGYKGASVTLPATVERIEQYAFAEATVITTLNLPSSLNFIGQYAFRNVKATLTFNGTSLTRLESYALAGYKGESVSLPSSVIELGDGAFSGSAIKAISVSSDVTLSGEGIFKDCTALWNVSLDAGEVPTSTFEGCTALTNVTLIGTTVIGFRAFYGCSALAGLSIPSGVTDIGSRAFDGCVLLSLLTFNGPAPTFGNNALPAEGVALVIKAPASVAAGYSHLEDDYVNVTVQSF